MPKFLILLWLVALPAWGQVFVSGSGQQGVLLEFFFETGCESCAVIRQTVLPELARRYSGYYDLRERDIGVQSNYLALVHYQELTGVKDNEPVSMVVAGRTYLAGVARIKAQLFPALEQALSRQLSDPTPGEAGGDATLRAQADSTLVLQQRVARFTLVGVIVAAAIDSINPCAIASLVFFMSLLSAARMGVSRMWVSGLAFLAACFVTYLGIGFGLLNVLGFLTAVREWRGLLDWTLMGVMAGLAFLSFRDAIRYHRTGLASEVSLKLPDWIQVRIHRVMKSGLKSHHLILGGLGMGAAVTLLESVCTGQVYVPALVMMLKCGQSTWRSLSYLVLYNAIFVLPLLLVLGLTCAGLKTPALVAWSRRNVVWSKILLGLLFLGMIALMVLLR